MTHSSRAGLAPILRRNSFTAAGHGHGTVSTADTPTSVLDPTGSNLLPSLAEYLRPQARGNWLMPYLGSVTPSYVEMVLRGGLAGNHVQMWQLFDLMVDTDPEIHACCGEYCDGAARKKIVVEPYAEEDEEPSDTAIEKQKLVSAALRRMRPDAASDENDIGGTVKDLLWSRFHGQTVLEIDWYDTYGSGQLNLVKILGFDVPVLLPRATSWVSPSCYVWDAAGRLKLVMPPDQMRAAAAGQRNAKALTESAIISTTAANPVGTTIDFPPDKFLIGINKGKAGSALGASDFRCLAWWWIASNFCGDFLMKTAELFGVPFRKVNYSSNVQEKDKAEIRSMLQNMGAAGWAMLPEGATMEFDSSTRGGGESPQAFLHHFADSQKRKVILRQTMTGGSHDSMGKGGGKAFGSVESDVKTDCINAGCANVAAVLNLQLVPSILMRNYGDGGDLEAPLVKLVDVDVGGAEDAQRDVALAAIMDVPDSYLRRRYGIPRPGPDDSIAGVDVGIQGAAAKAAADAQKQQAATAKAQAEQQRQQQVQSPEQEEQQQEEAPVEARSALKAGAASSKAGCLMAMLPDIAAKDFTKWAAGAVPADALTGDGLETEPHVTVLYGFDTGFDAKKLEAVVGEFGHRKPITFTVGKLSRFACDGFDVVKFDVDSQDLVALNSVLATAFGDDITPSQHAYNPHLTVAYVKTGESAGIDGSEWEGKQFTAHLFLYSEPQKTNRLEFKAKSAKSQAKDKAATALAGTLVPLMTRLKKISEVADADTRIELLQKVLADWPALAEAVKHDDSLAKAVTAEGVAQFVANLGNKRPKGTS